MKAFSWSYSKLKNFETCGVRHREVDILKNFKDEGEQLIWGNKVHDALRDAISTKTPLPAEMSDYQGWVDNILARPGEILVEQKFALTNEFSPTEWFSPAAWYRGIGDVVRIDKTVADIVDWKTGKIKEDRTQLMLMAQCVFAFFPSVLRCRAQFIWLQEDALTEERYNRRDMATNWMGLLDRVHTYEHAVTTKNFLAKPSFLCFKYCPVKTCSHYGKRH